MTVRPSIRLTVALSTLATASLLSGCAPLAKVSETKPRLGAQHGTIPELRRAEQAIADGSAEA